MTNNKQTQAGGDSPREDRQIVLRRVFNAPPQVVWEAWTDVNRVSQWWGPTGFTTTTHSQDLKPGGQWRFTMHGPDGTDYPNLVTYHEVLPAEKLVYSHGDTGESHMQTAHFEVTALFEKQGENKTRLTMSMAFASKEDRDRVVKVFGAVQGGLDTISRFAEFIGKQKGVSTDQKALAVALPDDKQIIMRWVIPSTPRKIFKAYTKAEYLRQWWGCPTFEVMVCESDFREGGQWRIVQKAPDGQVHPFKGEYKKIMAPTHITQTFIYDVEGIRDFVSVESLDLTEHDGLTTLTMTCAHQTKAARDGHLDSGMTDGVTTSMKRLEALVATF